MHKVLCNLCEFWLWVAKWYEAQDSTRSCRCLSEPKGKGHSATFVCVVGEERARLPLQKCMWPVFGKPQHWPRCFIAFGRRLTLPGMVVQQVMTELWIKSIRLTVFPQSTYAKGRDQTRCKVSQVSRYPAAHLLLWMDCLTGEVWNE